MKKDAKTYLRRIVTRTGGAEEDVGKANHVFVQFYSVWRTRGISKKKN